MLPLLGEKPNGKVNASGAIWFDGDHEKRKTLSRKAKWPRPAPTGKIA
jgi:hypothetical protein